jgi:hypothetical protein
MVTAVFPLERLWRLVSQGRMETTRLITVNHGLETTDEFQQTHPLLEPKTLLFQCAYHVLSIGIPFWIAIAGKRLMDS